MNLYQRRLAKISVLYPLLVFLRVRRLPRLWIVADERHVVAPSVGMRSLIGSALNALRKGTLAKMVAEELSIPSFSLDKDKHLAASVGYDVVRYKR